MTRITIQRLNFIHKHDTITHLFTYHTFRKHKAQMSDTQRDMIKLSTIQIEINRLLTNT